MESEEVQCVGLGEGVNQSGEFSAVRIVLLSLMQSLQKVDDDTVNGLANYEGANCGYQRHKMDDLWHVELTVACLLDGAPNNEN